MKPLLRHLKMVFGYSGSGLFLGRLVPHLAYLYAFSLAQLLQEEVVPDSLFPINFGYNFYGEFTSSQLSFFMCRFGAYCFVLLFP